MSPRELEHEMTGLTGSLSGETSDRLPSRPAVPGQETVYTPEPALRHPRELFSAMLSDLWSGRQLAWRMFLRNIRGLYRQTWLGLFWAFLPPLANTVVWCFIKESGAIELDRGLEVSYVVYVLAGLVIWQSFVEAFQAPLQVAQSNRGMLSKLRFPRESILMVAVLEILFNLAIRLVVLVPILLFFQASLTPWALLAPILILLLILVGLGLGLLLMPLGMLYHDVGRLIVVAIPVWMILTPIVYAAPKGWATSWLNWLNPAGPLLCAARDLVVFGSTEQLAAAGAYGLLSIPLVILGLVVYRVSIPILIERVSS